MADGPGRVLLVGMMGAGKTRVGRALAARIGAQYLDSDEQVEAATGRTVAEIFATDGEAAFRAQESQALRAATATGPPVVVSVAGGAVLDAANRAVITGAGTVVWLRATIDTLVERVGDGAGRPLLAGDPRRALDGLLVERRPLYAEVADLTVDVDDRSVDEVVDRIVAAIGEPT
ncbi:MAG TPA: shikimate kinase [Acidimicrobiales bacterium]|nr:shikimate kinase [Acidimicrobiales bacterium]